MRIHLSNGAWAIWTGSMFAAFKVCISLLCIWYLPTHRHWNLLAAASLSGLVSWAVFGSVLYFFFEMRDLVVHNQHRHGHHKRSQKRTSTRLH